MGAAKDFVMPKLGLTMSEGTIARWVIAAGSRFKAGDVVAVIETDKIAYDLEAPSSGILCEVLVSAGNIVPVGTPIGRWDIGDAEIEAPPGDVGSAVHLSAAHLNDREPPVTPSQDIGSTKKHSSIGEGQRILATPYARRLAQIANIDLQNLTGTGPRGRIKAADVNRSVSERTPAPTLPPAAAVQEPSPAANLLQSTKLFSAGVEVDVGRLLALNEEIIRNLPPLRPQLVHYVILAASRILGGDAARQFVIGLAISGDTPKSPLIFGGNDCSSLRPIVEYAHHRMSAETTEGGGTLWVAQAQEKISFISSEPPPGWSISLGVGSVRAAFHLDRDGRPISAPTISLVISYRTAELDPTQAESMLGRIRDLLENPTYLLIN
jgi:pyruvate dehydrogenase E2 component (dihydrolipoamide acetyltransferase)